MIVEGQLHGGVAHGVGAALLEELVPALFDWLADRLARRPQSSPGESP
jgi:hypothetical protein